MKRITALVCILFYININSQTPTPITLSNYQPEGFEGVSFPPTDWELYHLTPTATTDWEHSTTVGGFQSSSSSAIFNSIAATGNIHVLRTPSFDLTNAINPTVSFDLAYACDYDVNNDSDRFRLYRTFNTNGTTNWFTVPNSSFDNGTLVTAPNQSTYFIPDEVSDWETFTIDLTAFAGESYVRFAFEVNPGDVNNVIYIDNVNFFDASPLAVKEKNIISFDIFPNPTTEKITVNTIHNLTLENFKIYNTLGQNFDSFNITKVTDSTYELDLNHFRKGVYYISINLKDKISTKMIMIQ